MEDIELSTDQVILEEASTYVQPSVGPEMPMVLQVQDDDMIVPDKRQVASLKLGQTQVLPPPRLDILDTEIRN